MLESPSRKRLGRLAADASPAFVLLGSACPWCERYLDDTFVTRKAGVELHIDYNDTVPRLAAN